MRREDAGVNSPIADGKQFAFGAQGEDADARAQNKLERMTTTHQGDRDKKWANELPTKPTKQKESNQGWCSCFFMCCGSDEEDPAAERAAPTQQDNTPQADQPPADFMTQVDRPDTQKTASRSPAGGAPAPNGQSQETGRIDTPEVPGTVEMPARPASNISASGGTGAARSGDYPLTDDEIKQFGIKGNSDRGDPKGILEPNKTRFKKTLVLDLDETLVHSSFRPVDNPTFIIPVHIDQHVYNVYVLKRPYTDIFLERASKCYEIIIFTASLAKYADPLLNELDKKKVINGRLFRDSCVMNGKTYVKDMSVLGRKLQNLIIVDNSPLSYQFQPKNAINCTSWFDDPNDTELLDMLPLLETTLLKTPDVRDVLDAETMSYGELMTKRLRKTNTGDEPMWGFSDGTGS